MKNINTLEELRLERAAIQIRIEAKSKELSALTSHAREFYTPANLLGVVAGRIRVAIGFTDFLIRVYEKIMEIWEIRRQKKAREKMEAQDQQNAQDESQSSEPLNTNNE